MGESTPHLQLYKPDLGETGYHKKFARSMDRIDAAFPPMSGVAAGLQSRAGLTLVDEDQVPITFDPPSNAAEDPGGWVQSSAYDSPYYGKTWPASSWLALPPGVYTWAAYLQFAQKGLAERGYVDMYLDHLDDPTSLDPVYGGNMFLYAYSQNIYPVGGPSVPARGVQANGFIRIPDVDAAGNRIQTRAVGMVFFLEDNGYTMADSNEYAGKTNKECGYRSLTVCKVR